MLVTRGDDSDSNIRWQVHQASILQVSVHIAMRWIVLLVLKSRLPCGKRPRSNGLRVVPSNRQQENQDLSPTTARNWILPSTHELRRKICGSCENAGPTSTLILACSRTERRTQLTSTQTPDTCVLFQAAKFVRIHYSTIMDINTKEYYELNGGSMATF